MATLIQPSHVERRVAERRRSGYTGLLSADGMKVSWGGIWGGVLVAIGVLLLAAALGVAVGISTLQPGETDAASLGTGAGLWAAASLLAALFIGGMVSTRIGAISDRATGFFEGFLVWVVSVLLMAYFASSGIGMLAGGAFRLVGGATQAISGAIQGGGVDIDASASAERIVAQLNDPQTAQQVSTVTGLPVNEVRSTLGEIAQRVENARDNPAQVAAEVRQGLARLYEKATTGGALERRAQELKPEATRAAWMTFGALVLSLLAAVIGALLGRRRALRPAAVRRET